MAEPTKRAEMCRNCKWWDPSHSMASERSPGVYLKGLCRVGGPSRQKYPSDPQWPETRHDDWCGRHKPVPPKPEPAK